MIVGGPFNSGILALGPCPGATYNYQPAPPAIVERVRALERVVTAHGVPLATAALQFPFHHPAVTTVIPGARTPAEVEQNLGLLGSTVPPALWRDLKSEGSRPARRAHARMTGRGARRVDAHQHFWRLDRADYGWLTPAQAPIYRDFEPADLAPLLARAGIDATVLVQAAPTVAETRFLLELAAATPAVAGVVGWAPLDAPNAPDVVAELARAPHLKGLRPMIHDIPDVDWMLGPALAPGLRAIAASDLVFDALVRPPHLPNLRRLLDRHPDLRVVIDHGAKPEIGEGRREPWATHMAGLARDSRAWVKLSGLVTEDGPGWSVERLRPYVDHLLECFGPDRLIFGSDWPVVTLRASYAEWVAAALALIGGLERDAQDRVLGLNAIACYRL